jgi:hypothetical protein
LDPIEPREISDAGICDSRKPLNEYSGKGNQWEATSRARNGAVLWTALTAIFKEKEISGLVLPF